MNAAELFDALRPWLLAASGLPEVIEAHPSAPRPTGGYVLVNIIAASPVHDDPYDVDWSANPDPDAGTTEEPLFEHPRVEWEWTVSINVYASDAMDRARRIRTWAASSSAVDKLAPLTLGIPTSIRVIPEPIGERWEGRAQLDLSVRGLVTEAVPVDLIEETTAAFHAARGVAVEEPPAGDDTDFATTTVTKL